MKNKLEKNTYANNKSGSLIRIQIEGEIKKQNREKEKALKNISI